MATNTWTNSAGDGEWTTNGNWSIGTAPDDGDYNDVVIEQPNLSITLASTTSSLMNVNAETLYLDALLYFQGSVSLDVDSALYIQKGAEIDVEGHSDLSIGRLLTNSGSIYVYTGSILYTYGTPYLTAVLSGSGAVMLRGGSIEGEGTSSWENSGSTIIGYGNIGNENNDGNQKAQSDIGFSNDDNSRVIAKGGTLYVVTSRAITNGGLFEASSASNLVIDASVSNYVSNDGGEGTISAAGSGAFVYFDNASVTGGVIETSGGGSLVVGGGAFDTATLTLDQVSIEGTLDVFLPDSIPLAGSTLTLAATQSGDRGIVLDGVIDCGDSTVVVSGDVALTGQGHLDLSQGGDSSVINAAQSGSELDTSVLIDGDGIIGDGTLVLMNKGVIDSDGIGGSLSINLNDISLTTSINSGTMEATDGDTLTIGAGSQNGSAFTNAGTILAGTDSVVQLDQFSLTNDTNGTLKGGTWEAFGADATLTFWDNVTNDDATLILQGAGSIIRSQQEGSGDISLEKTLAGIGSGGTLDLINRNYTTSKAFTIGGTLDVSGATFKSGALKATAGSRILGSGTIASTVTQTGGTIAAASGRTLILTGKDSFYGTIGGTGTNAGTVTLASNMFTVAAITTFSSASTLVLDQAVLSLPSSLTCSCTFSDQSSTLSFASASSSTFTLTGKTTLSGGSITGLGTLFLNGATTSSGFGVSGSATLDIAGSTVVTGTVTLGSVSGGKVTAGTLDVGSHGDLYLSGAGSIALAKGATGKFVNAGSLLKNVSGTSKIGVATTSTGTIAAKAGTLDFAAAVTGTGKATISGGAVLEFDAAVAAQAVTFSTGGGALKLNDAPAFAGSIAALSAGDTLDIGHFGKGTSFTYAANAKNTGGTLTLTNGKASTKLTLVGSYAKTGFKLTTGTAGDTLVTYTAPKASARPEAEMAAPELHAHTAALAQSLFEGALGCAPSGTADWHTAALASPSWPPLALDAEAHSHA